MDSIRFEVQATVKQAEDLDSTVPPYRWHLVFESETKQLNQRVSNQISPTYVCLVVIRPSIITRASYIHVKFIVYYKHELNGVLSPMERMCGVSLADPPEGLDC